MRRVALTFDQHPQAYTTALALMNARGLIGSYFVDPFTINATGCPTRDNLAVMKIYGWTIGAYSGINMVSTLTADRNAAMQRFVDMKRIMRDFGLPAQTLAAAQRAWDGRLRNLTLNLFSRVRVGDTFIRQEYPVSDPLWIRNGSQPSLSASDTAASLDQNVTDFLAGQDDSLWTIVIHKIGVDSDPTYSVSVDAFTALLDRLKTERDAGTLRVVGYDDI